MKTTTISALVLAIATAATAAPKGSSKTKSATSAVAKSTSAKTTTPLVKASGSAPVPKGATKSTSASVVKSAGKPGAGTKVTAGVAGKTGTASATGVGASASVAPSDGTAAVLGEKGIAKSNRACKANLPLANNKNTASSGVLNSASTPTGVGAKAKAAGVKNAANPKNMKASASDKSIPVVKANGSTAKKTSGVKATSSVPKPKSTGKPKRWVVPDDIGDAAPTDLSNPRAIIGHGTSTTDVSSLSSAMHAIRSMTAGMEARDLDLLTRALGMNADITTSVSSPAAVPTIRARRPDPADVTNIHFDEAVTVTKTVTEDASPATTEISKTITSGDDEHDGEHHDHDRETGVKDGEGLHGSSLNDVSGSLGRRNDPCDGSQWELAADLGGMVACQGTSRTTSTAPYPMSGGDPAVKAQASGTVGAVLQRRQAGETSPADTDAPPASGMQGLHGVPQTAPATDSTAVGYVPNSQTLSVAGGSAAPTPEVDSAVSISPPGVAPAVPASDLAFASTAPAAMTPGAPISLTNPLDSSLLPGVVPGIRVSDLPSGSVPPDVTPATPSAPAVTPRVSVQPASLGTDTLRTLDSIPPSVPYTNPAQTPPTVSPPAVNPAAPVPPAPVAADTLSTLDATSAGTPPAQAPPAGAAPTDTFEAITSANVAPSLETSLAAPPGQEAAPYPIPGGDPELKVAPSGTTGAVLKRREAMTGGSAGLSIGIGSTGASLRRRAAVTGGSSGLAVVAVPTGSPIDMAPGQTIAPSAQTADFAPTTTPTERIGVTVNVNDETEIARRAPESPQTASAPPADPSIKDLLETGFKFQYLNEQKSDICTASREECERGSSTLGNNTAQYGYRHGYTQDKIQDMIHAAGLNRGAPDPLVHEKRSPDFATGLGSSPSDVDPAVQQVLKSSFKTLYWQTRVPGFCWGAKCGIKFTKFTRHCNMVVRSAYKHGCSHHMVQRMIDDAGLNHTAPPPESRELIAAGQPSDESSTDDISPRHDPMEKRWRHGDVECFLRDDFGVVSSYEDKLIRAKKSMATIVDAFAQYAYQQNVRQNELNLFMREAGLDRKAPKRGPKPPAPQLKDYNTPDHPLNTLMRRAPASTGDRSSEPSSDPTLSSFQKQEEAKEILRENFAHLQESMGGDKVNEVKVSYIEALAQLAYSYDIPQGTVTALMKKAKLDGTAPAPKPKTFASSSRSISPKVKRGSEPASDGMPSSSEPSEEAKKTFTKALDNYAARARLSEDTVMAIMKAINTAGGVPATESCADGSKFNTPDHPLNQLHDHWPEPEQPPRKDRKKNGKSADKKSNSQLFDHKPRALTTSPSGGMPDPPYNTTGSSDRAFGGANYEKRSEPSITSSHRAESNEPTPASTRSSNLARHEVADIYGYVQSVPNTDGNGTMPNLAGVKRTPGKWKDKAKEICEKGKGKWNTKKKKCDMPKQPRPHISYPIPKPEQDLSGHPGAQGKIGKNHAGTGSPLGAAGSSGLGVARGNGQGSGTGRIPGTGVGFGSGSAYGSVSGQSAPGGGHGSSPNAIPDDAASGNTEFEEDQLPVEDDTSSDCTSHPSGSECSDVSSGDADVGRGEGDLMFHADDLQYGSTGDEDVTNNVDGLGQHHSENRPHGQFKRSRKKGGNRGSNTTPPKGSSTTHVKSSASTTGSSSPTTGKSTTSSSKFTLKQVEREYCTPETGETDTKWICDFSTAKTGAGLFSADNSDKAAGIAHKALAPSDALNAATEHAKGWFDGGNARRDTGSAQPSTGPYPRRDSGVAMSSGSPKRRQEEGAAEATGNLKARQEGAPQPTGALKARQAEVPQPTGGANVRRNDGAAQSSDAVALPRTFFTRPILPRRSPTPTAALTEPTVKRYAFTAY